MVLNTLICSIKHFQVFFFSKENVRFQEVLIERVQSGSQAALLPDPAASLNVHNVACEDTARRSPLPVWQAGLLPPPTALRHPCPCRKRQKSSVGSDSSRDSQETFLSMWRLTADAGKTFEAKAKQVVILFFRMDSAFQKPRVFTAFDSVLPFLGIYPKKMLSIMLFFR